MCYNNRQNAEENVQYNAEAFYEIVRGFPDQLFLFLLNKRERSAKNRMKNNQAVLFQLINDNKNWKRICHFHLPQFFFYLPNIIPRETWMIWGYLSSCSWQNYLRQFPAKLPELVEMFSIKKLKMFAEYFYTYIEN